MTLSKNVERCYKEICCCKCKNMFELKGFPKLTPEPPNYKFVCSYFGFEGIMTVAKNQHGLCECFEPAEQEKDLVRRFALLRRQIDEEVGHMSNPDYFWSHWCYSEVKRMGWDAVPLMILDLKLDHWHFWTVGLMEITGHKPNYLKPGYVKGICDYWVDWAKENNIDVPDWPTIKDRRSGCSWYDYEILVS